MKVMEKSRILFAIAIFSFATEAFDLECANTSNSTCVVTSLRIKEKSETIDNVKGLALIAVKEIFIHGQQVKYLPSNFGEKFSALTTLKVQRSELQEINREDFKGIENLKLISFHNNDLVRINRNVFYDLQLLDELDLSNNNVIELEPKVFNKLISLKIINLDFNDLSELDAGLFRNNRKLEVVSLRNNNVKFLPTLIFETLKALKTVVLSNNEIKSLQDQLFASNTNLKEISVKDNQIEIVGTKNFEVFSKLDQFNFLYNPCTKNLKPDSTVENLTKILEKDCAADNSTRIVWLEDEVGEIRRFKREDSDKLKCAELELAYNSNNINSTRDEIFKRMEETKELIMSKGGQTQMSGVQSKEGEVEMKVDFEDVKNKIDSSKTEILNRLNSAGFSLDSETSGLIKALASESSIKTESAAVQSNVKSELKSAFTELEAKIDKDLRAITSQLRDSKFALDSDTLENIKSIVKEQTKEEEIARSFKKLEELLGDPSISKPVTSVSNVGETSSKISLSEKLQVIEETLNSLSETLKAKSNDASKPIQSNIKSDLESALTSKIDEGLTAITTQLKDNKLDPDILELIKTIAKEQTKEEEITRRFDKLEKLLGDPSISKSDPSSSAGDLATAEYSLSEKLQAIEKKLISLSEKVEAKSVVAPKPGDSNTDQGFTDFIVEDTYRL